MPAASSSARSASGVVHLLDGKVLYVLNDESHVRQASARRQFSNLLGEFTTCPITPDTLVRRVMRLGGQGVEPALAWLAAITTNARHHFWPDLLTHDQIRWHGLMAHRQVTDAELAGLARHHEGKLVSFDRGLVALHPDVGVAVEA
jgi:uncharacterized protein